MGTAEVDISKEHRIVDDVESSIHSQDAQAIDPAIEKSLVRRIDIVVLPTLGRINLNYLCKDLSHV